MKYVWCKQHIEFVHTQKYTAGTTAIIIIKKHNNVVRHNKIGERETQFIMLLFFCHYYYYYYVLYMMCLHFFLTHFNFMLFIHWRNYEPQTVINR